jgi:hypothetical protein
MAGEWQHKHNKIFWGTPRGRLVKNHRRSRPPPRPHPQSSGIFNKPTRLTARENVAVKSSDHTTQTCSAHWTGGQGVARAQTDRTGSTQDTRPGWLWLILLLFNDAVWTADIHNIASDETERRPWTLSREGFVRRRYWLSFLGDADKHSASRLFDQTT